MKQKYKKILIGDLCSRTPYGVKVSLIHKGETLIGTLDAVYPTDDRVIVDNLSKAIAPIDVRTGGFMIERHKVKPFLRPMSSMTEEEKGIYQSFFNYDGVEYPEEYIDWLLEHHFDYRGLIEKGLALEAKEEMYKHFGDMDVVVTSIEHKDKLGSGKVGWMVSVYPMNCRYDSCWHDYPVDACYEMILKLNKLKML